MVQQIKKRCILLLISMFYLFGNLNLDYSFYSGFKTISILYSFPLYLNLLASVLYSFNLGKVAFIA